MSATLHGAYDLARAGYSVTANYAVVDGICNCTHGAACPKPGKHPRGGHTNSTTNAAVIRRWPAQHRSSFNVGVDLETSKLVDWAPDSLEWLEEGKRRGIPDGALHWHSGSGPGHEHTVMRLPTGCPQVKINRSGEYDLMATGMAVAPPSVSGKGAYTWISERVIPLNELPEAPAWMVDMLKKQAAKAEPRQARESASGVTGDSNEDDEPPVRLDADGLRVWRGEAPVIHKDTGAVDRSGTLYRIGCLLEEANASKRAIREALANRDEVLGYHKFTTRPERYIVEAQNVINRERKPDPIVDLSGIGDASETEPEAAAGPCSGRCPEAKEYRRIIFGIRKVLQDQNLKPAARLTAIGLAFAVHAKQRQKGLAPDAEVTIHADTLAKESGLPRRTMDACMPALVDIGAVGKRVINVQQVTPNGPVPMGEYKKQSLITVPGASLVDKLETFVQAPKPERVKPGGWRPPRCPDCKTAAVLSQTTFVCDGCGQPTYQTKPRPVLPAIEDPSGQNGHTSTGIYGQFGQMPLPPCGEDAETTADARVNGHSGQMGRTADAAPDVRDGSGARVRREKPVPEGCARCIQCETLTKAGQVLCWTCHYRVTGEVRTMPQPVAS